MENGKGKSMTENRKKIIAAEFLLLVLITGLIFLLYLTGRPEETEGGEWSSPADLNGKTFVVVTGSAFTEIVQEQFPDSVIRYVNTWSDLSMNVAQGKADAFLAEKSSLAEYLDTEPRLVQLAEPVGKLRCSFAMEDTAFGRELRDSFNAYLEIIREDGSMEALYKKWENQDTAPDHIDPVPMTGEEKGTLSVVSVPDWAPFCYMNGSNPCGFYLDLLYHFCAYAGYTPEIEYVELDSALAGFSTGKYNLFCYGMVYSEERSEEMLFSDELYSDPVYVLINRENYAGGSEETAGEGQTSKIEALFQNIGKSFEKTFIREDRWKNVLSGLLVTAQISVLAGIFGTLLGALLCALRMSRKLFAQAFARLFIRIEQGVPIVVLLLVLYYIVFAESPFSAFWVCVFGFSLDFAAYTSENFRSGISAVPRGQALAAKALGFTPVRGFVKVVLPQAVIHILPVYIGQFISMVKLTSVAGYISVQDLTREADIIRSRTYEAFFPLIATALIYFLLAMLLTSWLKVLQKKFDPKLRRVPLSADQASGRLLRFARGITGAGKAAADVSAQKNVTNNDQLPDALDGEATPEKREGEKLLEVAHLGKDFGKVKPLSDVNCVVKRGDVISIIGPSGTGKSTFLNLLNRLEEPSCGEIIFRGETTTKKDYDLNRMRRSMGMVFQSFNLFPHLSTVENVMLAQVELLKKSRSEAFKRSMELLEMVGLSDRAFQYPDSLSGGQQQRVAIVRTLAMEPELILFDEPTSALDPTMVGEVLTVIRRLANEGMTMLIVTHEMKFARDVSSRVFYMDEGVIYEEGAPKQIFDQPEKEKTRRFIRQLKLYQNSITSEHFDFMTMNTEIMQFGERNMLERSLVDKLIRWVEEFCLQTLLLKLGIASLIEFQAEYAETDQSLLLRISWAGERIDPIQQGDELSIRILKHSARQMDYQYTDGKNMVTAVLD